MSDDKPLTVNGITYANKEELEKRREADATALANLMYDIYQEHKAREQRLEQEPNGFSFPAEGRMCSLCLGGGSGDMWYDKLGMRCMDCQKAYAQKIIPGYVFTDSKNKKHITDVGLAVRFSVERRVIKKLVREGMLKARVIQRPPYQDTLVFLKRENPDIATIVQAAINPTL